MPDRSLLLAVVVTLMTDAACGGCQPAATGGVSGNSGVAVDAGIAVDAGVAVDAGNRPQTWVDAVMATSAERLYFFKGAEYLRYNLTTDTADPGYPRATAVWWPGLGDAPVDAAVVLGPKAYFFRGEQYIRYDLATDAAEPGFPRSVTQDWPGLWPEGVDAAAVAGADQLVFFKGNQVILYNVTAQQAAPGYPLPISSYHPDLFPRGVDAVVATPSRVYFFGGPDYLRYMPGPVTADIGYPQSIRYLWPGLWDPHNGTGHPGINLPATVVPLLSSQPDASEIAARRARVSASVTAGWEEISSAYPQYLTSVEARLGVQGCGILRATDGSGTHRFRCATNTAGPMGIEIPPLNVGYIDWRTAAYHTAQVSQGDFMADDHTPLSIMAADNNAFFVEFVSANQATGSISGGLRIMVRYQEGGVEHRIQFSHLNNHVPSYVLEAVANGTALPCGTVFGFIGYTGNLWMAAPPMVDGPYSGSGAGLPVSHSHLWFVDDLANHEAIGLGARRALDYSGTYFFGGG